jgi:drug/metabolite transporter (DMT)-like permease
MPTLAAYAAIYLIWGSSFLAIRFAIDSIPPLMMMGLRCTAAGGLMLAWAALHGERASWRMWRDGAFVGALVGGAYGALAWAEERVPSGVAALLVATLPFWVAAFECGRRRKAPAPRLLAGLVVGLGGVALLVVRELTTSAAIVPALAIVLGEIAWAAGTLYGRPPRLPQSLALGAGMPLAAGGLLLIAAAWWANEFPRFDPHAVSVRSLTALAYLIVFGSLVAFSAYSWLMRVEPAARVATHAYVNPVVAVAIGSLVGGEPFTASIGAASAVIAGGVALVLGAPAIGGDPCSSTSTKPFADPRGTVRRCSDRCAA